MLLTRYSCLIRGALFAFVIRLLGGSVGRRFMVDRGVTFRYIPNHGITVGDNVFLGRGVVIDVNRRSRLTIGNNVLVSHFTVIAASSEIHISNDVQIAESCSIRDSDHRTNLGVPIRVQPLISGPVYIGEDVWIGRGTAILRGSRIGDQAIIGANSLVKHVVPERVIAVGAPARIIKHR